MTNNINKDYVAFFTEIEKSFEQQDSILSKISKKMSGMESEIEHLERMHRDVEQKMEELRELSNETIEKVQKLDKDESKSPRKIKNILKSLDGHEGESEADQKKRELENNAIDIIQAYSKEARIIHGNLAKMNELTQEIEQELSQEVSGFSELEEIEYTVDKMDNKMNSLDEDAKKLLKKLRN